MPRDPMGRPIIESRLTDTHFVIYSDNITLKIANGYGQYALAEWCERVARVVRMAAAMSQQESAAEFSGEVSESPVI